METITTATQNTDTYAIIDTPDPLGTTGIVYIVTRNGRPLTDRFGYTRYFATRNSARKRIARERSGDYHR